MIAVCRRSILSGKCDRSSFHMEGIRMFFYHAFFTLTALRFSAYIRSTPRPLWRDATDSWHLRCVTDLICLFFQSVYLFHIKACHLPIVQTEHISQKNFVCWRQEFLRSWKMEKLVKTRRKSCHENAWKTRYMRKTSWVYGTTSTSKVQKEDQYGRMLTPRATTRVRKFSQMTDGYRDHDPGSSIAKRWLTTKNTFDPISSFKTLFCDAHREILVFSGAMLTWTSNPILCTQKLIMQTLCLLWTRHQLFVVQNLLPMPFTAADKWIWHNFQIVLRKRLERITRTVHITQY